MKVYDIIKICNEAIPQEETWGGDEAYGAYNIEENFEVNKILFCVTATDEVVKHFEDNNYDLLISHHPFVKEVPMLVYHTALDCCEGGLNDVWRDHLGVKEARHFDENLGWYGEIEPQSFEKLLSKVKEFSGDVIGETYTNGKEIKSVVLCTGFGGLVYQEAAKTKADCYIFGEGFCLGKGVGFKHVIEIGHTLSEYMGVEFFRKLLPEMLIDSAPLNIDYFNRKEKGRINYEKVQTNKRKK